MPTEWTDLQAENLQSEAKEAVLRTLRRELQQQRVRVVPGESASSKAAGESAESKAAGAQSSAGDQVFDEASCPQPDTWCRHAGATDQFMTCAGARVRVRARARARVRATARVKVRARA